MAQYFFCCSKGKGGAISPFHLQKLYISDMTIVSPTKSQVSSQALYYMFMVASPLRTTTQLVTEKGMCQYLGVGDVYIISLMLCVWQQDISICICLKKLPVLWC